MTAMAEMKPFFDTVLKHIPRATDREKAEIRQELLDHLNDHMDALVIPLILSGLYYADNFAEGMGVRMTGTLESRGHFDDTYQLIQRQELDMEQDMGRHILRLYRMDLGHGRDGYQVTAYLLTYPEQPLQHYWDIDGLAFNATTCNGQKSFHTSCEGISEHHYAVSTTFPVELGAESAYLVMDHHTTHFEAEIPLDWGELG